MRKIYMIMGSKGSYEDFADWVEKCYLDEDNAIKIMGQMNKELEEKRLSPNYIKYLENDEDITTEMFDEFITISEQHLYWIQENIIEDYYFIKRNESIDDILK